MKRAIGSVRSGAVLTLALSAFIVSGSGCSAPVESFPDTGTAPSSAPDAALPPVIEPAPNVETPPNSCYIERDALGLRGTVPSNGANKCSGRQIVDFKSTCIAGTAAQCNAYISVNKDCARCMLGALKGDIPEALPHPALLPIGATIVTPNVVGCASLVLGRPDCAMNLTQYVVCTESACSSCETEKAAAECQKSATAAICKPMVDADCAAALDAGQAQWAPICRGRNFDDTYPKVASYLCGEGMSRDGGADGGGD